MKKGNLRCVVVILFLVIISCIIAVHVTHKHGINTNILDGNAKHAKNNSDEKKGLESRKMEAINNAIKSLGIPIDKNTQVDATLTKIEGANIPFLHSKLNGRESWVIRMRPIRIELTGKTNKYVSNLEIVMNPDTGNIATIKSTWPENEEAIASEPSASYAEKQMANEKIDGFPLLPPVVSFHDALSSIAKEGIGSPILAKQIVAYYVDAPRPVWMIIVRGIPTLPSAYPGVSINARNHLRHVIDATNGEWLRAKTTPQPE